MRRIWIAAIMAIVAACTASSGAEDPAAWRHRDGTPVGAGELAAAKTACREAAGHQLAFGETDLTSNPAYHPGGLGLMRADRTPGMLDSPDSPFWSAPPPPLDDCLTSHGLVSARP